MSRRGHHEPHQRIVRRALIVTFVGGAARVSHFQIRADVNFAGYRGYFQFKLWARWNISQCWTLRNIDRGSIFTHLSATASHSNNEVIFRSTAGNLKMDAMSRFRMCFFSNLDEPLGGIGGSIGVSGGTTAQAITMADRIWESLIGDDPADGYCLLDGQTGEIGHIRHREEARSVAR